MSDKGLEESRLHGHPISGLGRCAQSDFMKTLARQQPGENVDPEMFELPGDFAGQVRLFPLPHLVMFPGNVLPLHIFESRYREMLEDAVQGDRLITMATLISGNESDYYGRPPVAPHVCIGRVMSHEKTEKGTYNLLLVGIKRAQMGGEISPVRSFRRANVRVFEEQPADWGHPVTQALVRDLSKQLVASLPSSRELVAELLSRKISLGTLTDVIAFHFPFAVESKLRLLAEVDAARRAKLLLQLLPRRASSNTPTGFQPPGFSDN